MQGVNESDSVMLSWGIRVNRDSKDLQAPLDKLANRKDPMMLSFRKEIR